MHDSLHMVSTMMHEHDIAAAAAREHIAAALGPNAAPLALLANPLAAIDRAVARHYGIPAATLASRQRTDTVRAARHMAWALAWAGARITMRSLCRHYGGRRRVNIIRALTAFSRRLAGSAAPAAELSLIARQAFAGADRPLSEHTAKPPDAGPLRRRPCLTCNREFLSEGPHNRMCDACRVEHDGEPDACPILLPIPDWW